MRREEQSWRGIESGDAGSEEGWRDKENRGPRPGFFSVLSCPSLPVRAGGQSAGRGVVIAKIKNKWSLASKIPRADKINFVTHTQAECTLFGQISMTWVISCLCAWKS